MLATLLLALVPMSDIVTDRVDVIELNFVYDERCQKVLSQWIFWNWCEADRRHRVVAWSMRRKGESATATSDGWRLRFTDRCGVQREVTATSYREIHSQWDRELDDRSVLPVESRKGLSAWRRKH